MQLASFVRQYARSILAAAALLVCGTAAYGTDTYNGTTLSIPTVTVGNMTFANMVVKVGSIISGPTGSSGDISVDSYNPTNNQLTVPNVLFSGTTYHNVVVPVDQLESIASVAGADAYNGATLNIASVQVGSAIYSNVTVSVGAIQGVLGGMPNAVRDVYTPSSNLLTIPAVTVSGHVYTNASITVGSIMGVGGVGVPDVVGETQAAATSALTAVHLVAGSITQASSSSVPAGEVINQSPVAGTSVSLGSSVNLTISTGSSGGGGGSGTGLGWFAFTATPANSKSPAGQNGLFVVPSNPYEDNGSNVSWVIANTPVNALGVAFLFQSGDAGTGYWPYVGLYAALDGNNVVQIYSVNLTNASSVAPTATPIGNFGAKKLHSLDSICDSQSAQSNILDPTSWFIVVHIAGTSGCGVTTATGDSWVVVTATATATVNINSTSFDTFYSPSGLLTGMLLDEVVGSKTSLQLYADKSFTNPATLLSGVTEDDTILSQQIAAGGGFSGIGTVEFHSLSTATGTSLYRLDYTGASSFKAVPSYNPGGDSLSTPSTFTGTQSDGVNFYFTDTNFSSTMQEILYEEPIGAAGASPVAPTALYTAPSSPGFAPLGSNGSLVVLEALNFGTNTQTTMGTVPVGVANTATPALIGTFNGLAEESQMLSPSATSFSHSSIFVNVACSSDCTPTTKPDSTEILDPSGATLEGLTTNSAFLIQDGGIFGGGYILQIKGVTDTSGTTEGGGMLYDVPVANNASSYAGLAFQTCTSFTGTSCAKTGPFVMPAKSILLVVAGISSNFGEGVFQLGGVYSGVTANVNQQQIAVVSIPNTNILPGF